MRRTRIGLSTFLLLLLASGPASPGSDPSFLYVISDDIQLRIHPFRVTSSGVLAPLGSVALPEGFWSWDLTIAGSGPFAYAVAAVPGTLMGYAVNAADGSLSPLPGFPRTPLDQLPTTVVADGLGRFLYVANNGSGDIEAFRIEDNGQLTPVGQPFLTPGVLGSGSLAADQAGRYLFASAGGPYGNSTLSVLRIDAGTGALSHATGSPVVAEVGLPAVDPAGRFLYLATPASGQVSAFAIDPGSGALSELSNSPSPDYARAQDIVVDPKGRFVYVAHQGDAMMGTSPGTVSVLSRDPVTGALTQIADSPFASGANPRALWPDPTGAFLYVADGGAMQGGIGSIWEYQVKATGVLATLGQATAGNRPARMAGFAPVLANRPPDCSRARPSTDVIWPPNHRLVLVGVLGVTDPEGTSVSTAIESIRQDEPVDSTGDGEFAPDGFGIGTSTARVRADRTGAGNGRVYHVGFKAQDGGGASCSGVVKASVPHDKMRTAIDDGPTYDSTTP